MTKEIIQHREYVVCHMPFSSDKIVQCRCIDQCTLQYCVELCYKVLKIFSCTVISGWCTPEYDKIWKTNIDWTVYSVYTSVHCNIVSGFLLAIYETAYSAYLQYILVWCTQHIYSVLLYGIRVHPNIYQGFLLVDDTTVYYAILRCTPKKTKFLIG